MPDSYRTQSPRLAALPLAQSRHEELLSLGSSSTTWLYRRGRIRVRIAVRLGRLGIFNDENRVMLLAGLVGLGEGWRRADVEELLISSGGRVLTLGIKYKSAADRPALDGDRQVAIALASCFHAECHSGSRCS
ncbi:hypothetical protein L1887_55082 [Cichorium endivia]|nr:hypothetical protein L1887_55082 [Cichorium endivia]